MRLFGGEGIFMTLVYSKSRAEQIKTHSLGVNGVS